MNSYLDSLKVVTVVTEHSGQLHSPDLRQLLQGEGGWPASVLIPEPVSMSNQSEASISLCRPIGSKDYLKLWNCLPMTQARVGPTMLPGRGLSVIPDQSQVSISLCQPIGIKHYLLTTDQDHLEKRRAWRIPWHCSLPCEDQDHPRSWQEPDHRTPSTW